MTSDATPPNDKHSDKQNDKHELIALFEKLATASALLDENPFRTRAFENTARTLEALDDVSFAALSQSRSVGKSSVDIIVAYRQNKPIGALDVMTAQIPEGVWDFLKLPGVGPKKARALWQDLGITSLGELEYACKENRITLLKGFGAKTQQKLFDAIQEKKSQKGKLRLDEADAAYQKAVTLLRKAFPAVRAVQPVGALSRAEDIISVVEIAVLLPEQIKDTSTPIEVIRTALQKEIPQVRFLLHATNQTAAWPFLILSATSEDQYWLRLKQHALSRGIDLDEVLDEVLNTAFIPDADDAAQSALQRIFAAAAQIHPTVNPPAHHSDVFDTSVWATELDFPEDDIHWIYRALGLMWVPSERRHQYAPLVLQQKAQPTLVTLRDLRGALHNHTTASDGAATLVQMRQAAMQKGLHYLGINDHSQSAFYAQGLKTDALLAQQREIAQLNQEMQDIQDAQARRCLLFSGIESDILADGSLDYPDDILAKLDFVVASVHMRHKHTRDEATARLCLAASHPHTAVIGHPTGRLLLSRKPIDFDVAAFLQTCAKNQVAVELNASPQRLDFASEHLSLAKELGVLVSIAADAHSTTGLDDLAWGIRIARRAGLTAEDVLNCKSATELLAWRRSRRQSLD